MLNWIPAYVNPLSPAYMSACDIYDIYIYIHVAGKYIEVSSNARNIGVTFDTHMNLEKHVMNTCKTAFYHLRNIARI